MEKQWRFVGLLVLVEFALVTSVQGMRFVLDRNECFQHDVPADFDKVFVSFVIIKSDNPWTFSRAGVDLTIDGPYGQRLYTANRKEDDKFDFTAPKKGHYKFCFSNQSPIHETIDFDVHVGHVPTTDESIAKPEHFSPVMQQLSRLEESLYSVRFEQHWLSAQTDHQKIVNAAMRRRVFYKGLVEAFALVGASLLQVYLLQRLFERKLGRSSRV